MILKDAVRYVHHSYMHQECLRFDHEAVLPVAALRAWVEKESGMKEHFTDWDDGYQQAMLKLLAELEGL